MLSISNPTEHRFWFILNSFDDFHVQPILSLYLSSSGSTKDIKDVMLMEVNIPEPHIFVTILRILMFPWNRWLSHRFVCQTS